MVGTSFRRRTTKTPFSRFLFRGPSDSGSRPAQASFVELVRARRFKEICRILKSSAGSDIEVWLSPSDNKTDNDFPLIFLCKHQPTVAVVKALLWRCNVWDFDGCTVLHVALRYGCAPAVVEVILSFDPDIVGVRDEDGRTALHYLMGSNGKQFRKQQLISMAHSLITLMPQCATSKDNSGMTPYDLALMNGKVDRDLLKVMRRIVQKGKGDRSMRTVTTTSNSDSPEVPKQVTPARQYNDDDMSSVGSGGVSKHQHANRNRKIHCRAKRLCL